MLGNLLSKSLTSAFTFSEILHGIVSQVYRDLKLYIKKVTESMALYLANKETENILFKPIKVRKILLLYAVAYAEIHLKYYNIQSNNVFCFLLFHCEAI